MSSSNSSRSDASAEDTVKRDILGPGDFTELITVEGTVGNQYGVAKIEFSTRTKSLNHEDVPESLLPAGFKSYFVSNDGGRMSASPTDVRWYQLNDDQAIEVSWKLESFRRKPKPPGGEFRKTRKDFLMMSRGVQGFQCTVTDSAYVKPVSDDEESIAIGPATYPFKGQLSTKENTKDGKKAVVFNIKEYSDEPDFSVPNIYMEEDGTCTKTTFSKHTTSANLRTGSQSTNTHDLPLKRSIRGTSDGTAYADPPEDCSRTFHLPDADVTFNWEVEKDYIPQDGESVEPVYRDEVYTAELTPRGFVSKHTATRRRPPASEREGDIMEFSEADPKAGLREQKEGEFYQGMFRQYLGTGVKWFPGYGSETAADED